MARKTRRRRKATPGFEYVGNKLVPLEGTIYNDETEEWEISSEQQDLADSYASGEIPRHEEIPVDIHGQDYYNWEGYNAQQEEPTPTDPSSDPHWSEFGPDTLAPDETPVPTFQQTVWDHKDEEWETALRERDEDMKKRSLLSGGKSEGRSGGYGKKRIAEQSRRQMNLTGSSRSSLITERYA